MINGFVYQECRVECGQVNAKSSQQSLWHTSQWTILYATLLYTNSCKLRDIAEVPKDDRFRDRGSYVAGVVVAFIYHFHSWLADSDSGCIIGQQGLSRASSRDLENLGRKERQVQGRTFRAAAG